MVSISGHTCPPLIELLYTPSRWKSFSSRGLGSEIGSAYKQTAVPVITQIIRLSVIEILFLNANTEFFPVSFTFVINYVYN